MVVEIHNITRTTKNSNYIKYTFHDNRTNSAGFIVLERYGEVYNLELMHVSPRNKGYGTVFLLHVLKEENLSPSQMTVHPINKSAEIFFRKMGFVFRIRFIETNDIE